MNKLSVIITFKNENIELVKTCQNIRETAGDNVDIIILNDASDDNFDYENNIKQYNVDYHNSVIRLGTSLGREHCLTFCKTPYFIILDGHCRFNTENWYNIAINIMEKNEDCIYCCGCRYFNDTCIYDAVGYGGYFTYKPQHLLNCNWNVNKISETEFNIPCILGANYLCSMRWWNYIQGLKGLKLYGRDEPFLSRKSWMLGGTVKCIPQIETLHKKRENGIPYKCSYTENLYNDLVMSYILFPEYYNKILSFFKTRYNKNHIEKICNDIENSKSRLDELQKYIIKNKKLSFSDIEKLNINFIKSII